jgi:hypothetical protein
MDFNFTPEEEELLKASKEGNMEKVKEYIQGEVNIHKGDEFPLRLACKNGHLEVVKYLIEEAGADIYGGNQKFLGLASYYGHLEVVKYLIDVAKVNVIYVIILLYFRQLKEVI